MHLFAVDGSATVLPSKENKKCDGKCNEKILLADVTPSSICKETFLKYIGLLDENGGKHSAALIAFRADGQQSANDYDPLSIINAGAASSSFEPISLAPTPIVVDDEIPNAVCEHNPLRLLYNQSAYHLTVINIKRQKDLAGWYDDDLIMFQLCLAVGNNESCFITSTFALDLTVFNYSAKNHYPPPSRTHNHMKSYFKREWLNGTRKYLIIPVHIGGCHWVAIVVTNPGNLFVKNVPRPQILIFDAKKYAGEHVEIAVDHLKSILLFSYQCAQGKITSRDSLEMMQNAVQVVHVNVDPKQMDSFNCGPFLIFCVRHFMENTELYPFTGIDNSFRLPGTIEVERKLQSGKIQTLLASSKARSSILTVVDCLDILHSGSNEIPPIEPLKKKMKLIINPKVKNSKR